MALMKNLLDPKDVLDKILKCEVNQEVDIGLFDTWKKIDKHTWLKKNTCDGSYTFEFSDKKTHEEMINSMLDLITKK